MILGYSDGWDPPGLEDKGVFNTLHTIVAISFESSSSLAESRENRLWDGYRQEGLVKACILAT